MVQLWLPAPPPQPGQYPPRCMEQRAQLRPQREKRVSSLIKPFMSLPPSKPQCRFLPNTGDSLGVGVVAVFVAPEFLQKADLARFVPADEGEPVKALDGAVRHGTPEGPLHHSLVSLVEILPDVPPLHGATGVPLVKPQLDLPTSVVLRPPAFDVDGVGAKSSSMPVSCLSSHMENHCWILLSRCFSASISISPAPSPGQHPKASDIPYPFLPRFGSPLAGRGTGPGFPSGRRGMPVGIHSPGAGAKDRSTAVSRCLFRDTPATMRWPVRGVVVNVAVVLHDAAPRRPYHFSSTSATRQWSPGRVPKPSI